MNNDYWKQKQKSREFWKELRLEEQAEIEKDERTREMDLKRTCPTCYIIRSAFEIGNGTCDSCGLDTAIRLGRCI